MALNPPPRFDQFALESGTTVEDKYFFIDGCEGIETRRPFWKLGTTKSPDIRNFRINQQKQLVASKGFTHIGTTLNSQSSVAVFGYAVKGNTDLYIVTTAGIQVGRLTISGVTDIIALTGPTLQLSLGERVTFAAWGEQYLLIATRVHKLIEVDLVAGTYAFNDEAPEGAGHIEIMNGRVVLSDFVLTPRRVQWSAKFDKDDWDGLGAGFEDLPSVNGLDPVWGVYPYSETQGFVVRQDSINIVQTSDSFDAPFRFQQQYNDVKCYAPRSICKIPGGVILHTYANVMVLTPGERRFVGDPVLARDFNSATTQTLTIFATYDPIEREYWIYGLDEITSGKALHCYNLFHNVWTSITPVTANTAMPYFTYVGGLGSTAYEDLSGAYSVQVETLDTLGAGSGGHELIYTAQGTLMYTLSAGSGGANGWRIETGEIELDSPANKLSVVDVEVGFICVTAATFDIGVQKIQEGTITTLENKAVTINTTQPQKLNFPCSITGHTVRFAAFANGGGGSGGLGSGTGLSPVLLDYVRVRCLKSARSVTA